MARRKSRAAAMCAPPKSANESSIALASTVSFAGRSFHASSGHLRMMAALYMPSKSCLVFSG
eukprot:CAMPEP_0172678064 /NCGR_PEP_ID=MMETSP1074-20121228/15114_1 /TAXON_ID=2916 /ORGANISM="Ceratium fusus, Strain PA161109" /LENGTH=61 /DNA_ID=CAMNT_0013496011 /DNA_START=509 /DNA_END=694 /DNA_ORIENTATION=-